MNGISHGCVRTKAAAVLIGAANSAAANEQTIHERVD